MIQRLLPIFSSGMCSNNQLNNIVITLLLNRIQMWFLTWLDSMIFSYKEKNSFLIKMIQFCVCISIIFIGNEQTVSHWWHLEPLTLSFFLISDLCIFCLECTYQKCLKKMCISFQISYLMEFFLNQYKKCHFLTFILLITIIRKEFPLLKHV